MHSSVGGFVCAVLTSRIIGSASSKLSSRYRRLLRSEGVTEDGIAPNSLSLAPFSIFLFQFLGLQCSCFFFHKGSFDYDRAVRGRCCQGRSACWELSEA